MKDIKFGWLAWIIVVFLYGYLEKWFFQTYINGKPLQTQ